MVVVVFCAFLSLCCHIRTRRRRLSASACFFLYASSPFSFVNLSHTNIFKRSNPNHSLLKGLGLLNIVCGPRMGLFRLFVLQRARDARRLKCSTDLLPATHVVGGVDGGPCVEQKLRHGHRIFLGVACGRGMEGVPTRLPSCVAQQCHPSWAA